MHASAPFVGALDKTKGIVDEGYARNSSLYAAASQGLTTSTSAFYHAANGDGPPPPLFSYRSPGSSAALATAGLSPAVGSGAMPGLPRSRGPLTPGQAAGRSPAAGQNYRFPTS